MNHFTDFFDNIFQAKDGIRDGTVTGVQTCALPISGSRRHAADDVAPHFARVFAASVGGAMAGRRMTGVLGGAINVASQLLLHRQEEQRKRRDQATELALKFKTELALDAAKQ